MHEIERNDKIVNKIDKPMKRLKVANFLVNLSLALSVIGMLGCYWAYLIFDIPSLYAVMILIGTIVSLTGYKYAVEWQVKVFDDFLKATQTMINELKDPYHDEDDEDG